MQRSGDRGSKVIRLLIVDDVPDMVQNVHKLLRFESGIQIVGAVASAEEALAKVPALQPDVVLMDINLRGRYDGLQATEYITQHWQWQTCVIMMSVQREPEYIARAMTLGARGYLAKPFTGDELIGTIKTVHARFERDRGGRPPGDPLPPRPEPTRHKIITVYSPKGGCGRSVIATNLAIALRRETNKRVVLVDANLSSGDVHVMLNMNPSSSIEDLREAVGTLEQDQINGAVAFEPKSGIGLVRAPVSIEAAERFTADAMKAVLIELSDHFDYVVVDSDTTYSDYTFTTLEVANLVLLITTLEITTINRVGQFFEIADRLDNVIPKIQMVCNRVDTVYAIKPRHLETRFNRRFISQIPDDPHLVAATVNKGEPFTLSQKNAPISKAIEKLAQRTVEVLK